MNFTDNKSRNVSNLTVESSFNPVPLKCKGIRPSKYVPQITNELYTNYTITKVIASKIVATNVSGLRSPDAAAED